MRPRKEGKGSWGWKTAKKSPEKWLKLSVKRWDYNLSKLMLCKQERFLSETFDFPRVKASVKSISEATKLLSTKVKLAERQLLQKAQLLLLMDAKPYFTFSCSFLYILHVIFKPVTSLKLRSDFIPSWSSFWMINFDLKLLLFLIFSSLSSIAWSTFWGNRQSRSVSFQK